MIEEDRKKIRMNAAIRDLIKAFIDQKRDSRLSIVMGHAEFMRPLGSMLTIVGMKIPGQRHAQNHLHAFRY
jgi:hypothetical protein